MTKPFNNKPTDPRTRRRLREVPFYQRSPAGLTEETRRITDRDVEDLFNGLAFQANRATALIRELEPRLAKMAIPISSDAIEVRNAVRRQLKIQHDPLEVPFDLYKNMLDQIVRESRKLRFEMVGDFTGDPLTDARVYNRHIKSGGKGLSKWDEFLLNMEPFLLWFLLNQLLGQFQAMEHKEACAAKQPIGSEDPPLMHRYAIAIAAMMLILGMQEDHILFALNRPNVPLGLPNTDILDRARRLVESDGLNRELSELVGANDPQVIIQYCDGYINRNPAGYEEWIAYRDLRDVREDVSVTYIHSHMYSPGTRELLYYEYTNEHTTPAPSNTFFGSLFFGGGGGRQVRTTNPEAYASLTSRQYYGLVQQLSVVDRSISSIAGVITSGFALDVLCCIGRFLGQADIEFLRKVRKVLQIAEGFMRGQLNLYLASPTALLDYVTASVQNQIVAQLNRLIQNAFDPVWDFLKDLGEDELDALLYCPLIGDLFYMISNAVGEAQNRLSSLIRAHLSRVNILHSNIYKRWGAIYDLRRARTILAIIDAVIEAIEVCAELDQRPGGGPAIPSPGEDPTILQAVPQPLKLPPEVVEKFFRNPNPVPRPGSLRDIPPAGKLVSAADEDVTVENFREFCRGMVPDDLIRSVYADRESA